MRQEKIHWPVLLFLASLKIGVHAFALGRYGFHRDEFLYLALGRHPDWGYWSNPPFIGWLSWLVQYTLGGSLVATRLMPLMAGALLVVVTGVMAAEMGGRRYAQFLAGTAALLSPAYLRAAGLFQPVIFDILFWAVLTLLFLRFLRTGRQRPVILFGLFFGFGFLNKYSVLFLLIAIAVVLLLGSHRKVLWSSAAGKAALLATILIAPNLWWQIQYGFPVVSHMNELARNQLVNVRPVAFLIDQLVMNFSGLLIWIAGLFFLLFSKRAAGLRSAGCLYIAVLAIFLLLRGKSYYTLGIYPILFAAGGLFWENHLRQIWLCMLLPGFMALLIIPLLPVGLPILAIERELIYCRWLAQNAGLDMITRWANGRQHPLPQDFADMLGWQELATLAEEAGRRVPAGETVLLFAENYGQAGAIDHLADEPALPPAVSFSDSYRLWAPDTTNATTLIYVNDELGKDVANLFEKVERIGLITNPLARENGTAVYLLRAPREPVGNLWSQRVSQVKSWKE